MADQPYVIAGASGRVGGVIARALLERGEKVRAIGRNYDRLRALEGRGAELSLGDLEDGLFVKESFAGARAAFVMLPTNFDIQRGLRAWQERLIEHQARAIEVNQLPYVLQLSTVGAQLESGAGMLEALRAFEARLERTKANVLCLRAAYFLDNLLARIPMIRELGFFADALRPELRIPMIATRDIGEVAARRLRALDWEGLLVEELLGERDLSMAEVARALGQAIGRPDLHYQQVSYEAAQQAMVEAGVPEEFAAGYLETIRAFNDGRLRPTQPRSPRTTTPTSVEQFAREIFAPAFG